MTIKDVKEMYKGEYVDVEVYKAISDGRYYPCRFHTDNCNAVDDDEYNNNSEVGIYELMTEEEYNNSITANCCIKADFDEWFGDKNAKVLCIMLDNQNK